MDDSVLELPAAMDGRVALTLTSTTGTNHSGAAQPVRGTHQLLPV
jgi:hypothetical protein